MLKTLPFLLLFTRGLFAAYRGIFTLDCEEAAGPCNNACYYINCLNGGSNVFMSHGNDPDPNPKRKRNTARSGASVTGGPPCRKLPFSQKFYDTYPNWQNMGVDEQLETDEFPMAAFKQQDFQLGAWPPRNTLRCVPRVQNGRAGQLYSEFRQGKGTWGNNSPYPQIRAQRQGAGELRDGDTFSMAFRNTNPRTTPYCQAPPALSCTNDGRQFHLTKLQGTGDTRYGDGILHWPYNKAIDNNYELTDSNGPRDVPIEAFMVRIRRGNPDIQSFQAESLYFSGSQGWVRSSNVAVRNIGQGQGFQIPATSHIVLPIGVQVVEHGLCGGLLIAFGDPRNGPRAFAFDTYDTGISDQQYPLLGGLGQTRQGGRYCDQSFPTDDDGEEITTEFIIECVFPGA